MTVFQNALQVIVVLILVVLVPALLVGLVVAMIQAATQINEMTLTFVPKLIVVALVILIAGPALLNTLLGFTTHLIESIPELIG